MRIVEPNGIDSETLAEAVSGRRERKSAELRPEIKLVASPTTAEALEEVAVDVHREAMFPRCRDVRLADRARATPLGTALSGWFIGDKCQHLTNGDSRSDRAVVERAVVAWTHGLGPRGLPSLAAPDWRVRAACRSARCARYDLPLNRWMMALSTIRSSKAIANGGSPR